MSAVSESITDIDNFRLVSPSLATSGQPTELQLAALAAAGYEVVINLALHDDPRYSLADEAATVCALGMEYVHIPVRFAAPTTRDLNSFCDALARLRGRTVWVHCASNKRVTAFLGLYWVLREGWKSTEAFRLMFSVWQPNDVWAAFINKAMHSGVPVTNQFDRRVSERHER